VAHDDKETLRTYLRSLVDTNVLPGLCFAVYTRHASGGENVAFMEEYGVADIQKGTPFAKDTVVDVASLSKALIAVLAQTFVEEGKLQWEDELADYIPAFATHNLTVYAGEGLGAGNVLKQPCRTAFTIEQLATHTSGLCTPFIQWDVGMTRLHSYVTHQLQKPPKGSDLGAFCEMVARYPLAFQPGTDWYYGDGFDVLGRVCEVVGGASLDDLLRERVTSKLGMHDTGFSVPKETLPRAAPVYVNKARLMASIGKGKDEDDVNMMGENSSKYTRGATGVAPGYKLTELERFVRTGGRPNTEIGQSGDFPSRLASKAVMPLGFGFKRAPKAALGGRGLASSAADLLTFWKWIANMGCQEGPQVLSPASIEAITRNRLPSITATRRNPLGVLSIPPDMLRTVAMDRLGKQGQCFLGYKSGDEEFQAGQTVGMVQLAGMWSSLAWADPVKGYAAVLVTNYGPVSSVPHHLCAELNVHVQGFLNQTEPPAMPKAKL